MFLCLSLSRVNVLDISVTSLLRLSFTCALLNITCVVNSFNVYVVFWDLTSLISLFFYSLYAYKVQVLLLMIRLSFIFIIERE